MNAKWIKSFVAGLVVAIAAVPIVAQDSQAGIVAVMDVAKVFKEFPAFEAKMAAIKSEADRLKEQIQEEQKQIQQKAAGMQKTFNVGTTERNNMEASLEQEQTSLRTKARQAEQDLLNREAQIYFETYTQMQSVVTSVAQEYGIALVLRFESGDIDSTDRAEVIKGVNRAIVYHHKLDLTNMVIDRMNGSQAKAITGTSNK